MAITANYNDQPMRGLTEAQYETMRHHLHEQVVARMDRNAYPEGEAEKLATDTLNNEWSEALTAREWLARVGERLGIDVSRCVGV